MNKLIADLTVLYNKLHTLHYNVVGTEFYSLHVMLEGEYDKVHDWIDEVAEGLKIKGEYPIASLKEIIELSTIKDAEARDYKGDEICELLLTDYTALVSDMTALKDGATLTQENMLDEMIMYLEKQIWFLKSTIK